MGRNPRTGPVGLRLAHRGVSMGTCHVLCDGRKPSGTVPGSVAVYPRAELTHLALRRPSLRPADVALLRALIPKISCETDRGSSAWTAAFLRSRSLKPIDIAL